MHLIDTNIFIELIQDQENSKQCEKILTEVTEGNLKASVTKFSLHAIEGLNTEKPEIVRKFLKQVDRSIGLEVQDTSLEEEKEIAAYATESELDYDDALQYFVAVREDIEKIISFDTDFNDTDLERIEPEDVLD